MRKVLYLFSSFSDQDVDWFIGAGKKEDIESGQNIIQEGREVKTLYITLSGKFKVTANNKEIAKIGPGEILGELSFLDSRPPSASVIAQENAIVLAISVTRLRSKLTVDTGFASRFYFALGVLLADRMRETTQHLAVGSPRTLDRNTEEFGEIAASILDDISIAAARFDKLRQTVLSD